MADVFISYARSDEAFAARLAGVLEALGLTVWWDRKLATGDDWELEIERQLDAAAAVVVVWSPSSVKSKPVRAEARRADRKGKLAPIVIDNAEPPLFSDGIQFEDFTHWAGETSSFAFQDLWRQLMALCRSQAAAAAVPRDGATPIGRVTEVDRLDPTAPMLRVGLFNRPMPAFGTVGAFLEFLFIAGGVVWLFIDREELVGAYYGWLINAALFAVVMFSAAESRLSQGARAMVARWLRPQPDAAPIRSTSAFLALFEAVFGKRHLSWRCFAASSVASVLLYALLLVALTPFALLQEQIAKLLAEGVAPPTDINPYGTAYVSSTLLETNAALLFIAIPVANIVVDYLSLWETRVVLRLAARGMPTAVAILLDALLTGAVFVAFLPLGPVAFSVGLEAASGGLTEATLANAVTLSLEIWRSLWLFSTTGFPGEFLSAAAGEGNLTSSSILIALVTTFTTSLWLWAALFFAPLVRLLSWSRRRGLSLVGRLLNTEARPIAPLGYVAAALIGLVGLGLDLGARAMASAAPRGPLAAGAVFRDCAVCPEMVALPGGRYWIGSPEDEPGREPLKSIGILEGPQTQLTIPAFAMGRFEVTFREWDACVRETAAKPEGERCRAIPRGNTPTTLEGRDAPSFGDQGWGRGLRPVVTVSWNDAQAFIAWLNTKVAGQGVRYHLPSEAQWEYAARARVDGSKAEPAYFFGADADAGCGFMNGADQALADVNEQWRGRALACDDGYAFTAPVGAYTPNAFGLHDILGNVFEWVEDCYHAGHEARTITEEAWATGCDVENSAVLRGGSWVDDPQILRSASRSGIPRVLRNGYFGFRVARTLVE